MNRKARLILSGILILIILFFALLLLNKSSNLSQTLLGRFLQVELLDQEGAVNTRETVMRLLPSEGKVLSVQPHSYMTIDPDATENATAITAPVSDAHVATANGYLLFYQQMGQSLKLWRKDKEVCSIDTEFAILSASVNEDGDMVVITEDSGHKSVILVYRRNGELVYRWHSGANLATHASLSADRNELAVCTLSLEHTAPQATLYLFNIHRTEPILQKDLGERIPTFTQMSEKDLIVVGFSDGVCAFRRNGEAVYNIECSGTLKNWSLSDPYAPCLLVSEGGTDVLYFYDKDEVAHRHDSATELDLLSTYKNLAVVSGINRIQLIDRHARVLATFDADHEVREICMLDKKTVAYSTGNEVQFLSIR